MGAFNVPVSTIIHDFLKAGVDPLARNNMGVPAFLQIRPFKESAREELRLVTDAMLNVEGLSKQERRLIEAQCRLIDEALGQGDPRKAERIIAALERAWITARDFAPADDQARVPVWVQSFLEPLRDGKRASKLLETLTSPDVVMKLRMVNDLVREFTAHVVLPQVLLDYSRQLGVPLTDECLKNLDCAHPGLLLKLEPVVKAELFKGRSIDKIIGLNEAWHDPQVVFPDALKPIKAAGEWHSLTGQKEHAVAELRGIVIHVLTNGDELEQEGKIMDHCVGRGGYTSQCLKGTCHIFSVRKEGVEKPLSTIEASWDGKSFNILQNYGERNEAAPQEAKLAAKWLKSQIESGEIKTSRQTGETPESRKINARPQILRTIGFEICQSNINQAFAEYCRNPKRRAREYNPTSGEFDTISPRTKLIAGNLNTDLRGDSFVMRDESGRPLRTSIGYDRLPADVWFAEGGIRDKAMAATLQPDIDRELESRRVQQAEAAAALAEKEAAAQEQPRQWQQRVAPHSVPQPQRWTERLKLQVRNALPWQRRQGNSQQPSFRRE